MSRELSMKVHVRKHDFQLHETEVPTIVSVINVEAKPNVLLIVLQAQLNI